MQVVQVKEAHPSLQCHPLPIECQANYYNKKKCESIRLASNRSYCQAIWMGSGVQYSATAAVHGGVQPGPNAGKELHAITMSQGRCQKPSQGPQMPTGAQAEGCEGLRTICQLDNCCTNWNVS